MEKAPVIECRGLNYVSQPRLNEPLRSSMDLCLPTACRCRNWGRGNFKRLAGAALISSARSGSTSLGLRRAAGRGSKKRAK